MPPMPPLDYLQTPDHIWKPYKFDRVEIRGRTEAGQPVHMSILGTCWSEFRGGPNLCELADAAGQIIGPGWYGLASCRLLGFRDE